MAKKRQTAKEASESGKTDAGKGGTLLGTTRKPANESPRVSSAKRRQR